MYTRNIDGETTTVKLDGDIDLYNAEEFRAAITGITGNLVLDCHELNYIDSTGLGVLVAVFKNNGKNVKIIGLKQHLYRIFELTGLTAVFDIEVAR